MEDDKTRYEHEQYSAAIIRTELRQAIEDHPQNQNYRIRAEEIAALLEGSARVARTAFWRELVSGQMDADRIDYLLRDSLHTGVDYGRFDWQRLLNTVEVVPGASGRGPRLGVHEGGFHAAESLVLARYLMFTQVYFHRTRVAFDHHLQNALLQILKDGVFPKPDGKELRAFLRWDDWRVLGALASGKGGEHGKRLSNRDHYREVFHTPDIPTENDLAVLRKIRKSLGNLITAEQRADKSWYKVGEPDIPIISDNPSREVHPLSRFSNVVKGLTPIEKVMLFSCKEDAPLARNKIQSILD